MLIDPPCIRPLLGCSDGYVGGTDTSSTSGGGGTYSYSSSSSSLSFGSRSSSPGSEFDLSRYLGSGASIVRSQKEYFAMYALKAKNVGNSALKAVKVLHGPFPYSLTFDSAKSSRECVQNQKTIECTTDLAAGQNKDFTIAYKTSSSFSCGLARFLQTAKSTLSSLSGSSNPVVVSVSCAVQSVDAGSSSRSSSSSNVGGASSLPANLYGSGAFALQPTTGYKPVSGYKPYVMPRTGAAADYFASVTSSEFVVIPKGADSKDSFSISIVPILVLSVLSVAILYKLRKSSFYTH